MFALVAGSFKGDLDGQPGDGVYLAGLGARVARRPAEQEEVDELVVANTGTGGIPILDARQGLEDFTFQSRFFAYFALRGGFRRLARFDHAFGQGPAGGAMGGDQGHFRGIGRAPHHHSARRVDGFSPGHGRPIPCLLHVE